MDLKFEIQDVPFYYGDDNRKRLIEKEIKFNFRSEDILVAGFPRSGTSFRKNIVWLVANNADVETAKARKEWDRIPKLDRFTLEDGEPTALEKVAAMEGKTRVVFSHLPYALHGPQIEASGMKVIYMARNPKDVVVSYYHARSFLRPQYGPIVEKMDFSQCLQHLSGDFDRGNLLDHFLGYWKHKENPNFLFLFFEEEHKNYSAIVQKIAKFLGKTVTEEQERKIVEFISFESFKEHSRQEWAGSLTVVGSKSDDHIRKGDVGQWKQYFTVAQNQAFDQLIEEKLRGYDIPFQYE